LGKAAGSGRGGDEGWVRRGGPLLLSYTGVSRLEPRLLLRLTSTLAGDVSYVKTRASALFRGCLSDRFPRSARICRYQGGRSACQEGRRPVRLQGYRGGWLVLRGLVSLCLLCEI